MASARFSEVLAFLLCRDMTGVQTPPFKFHGSFMETYADYRLCVQHTLALYDFLFLATCVFFLSATVVTVAGVKYVLGDGCACLSAVVFGLVCVYASSLL